MTLPINNQVYTAAMKRLLATLALAVLACSQPGASTDAGPVPAAIRSTEPGFVRPPRVPLISEGIPKRHRVSPPDVRTPAQQAAAACTARDGSWACSSPKPKTFAAAGATTPIIPSSWTVPAWFFDPQNVSGTASDNNSCTSSGAACRTWGEIYVHRLGGPYANLQPPLVTVTELSSQSASVDLVSVVLDPDSDLQFNGTLTQVTTATVGTFVPRNRAAGTANTITASGQSGAYWTPFVGDLVHDTTANAWFWIDADLGSATARITEPLALYSGTESYPPPYVTIANSDALSVNTESLLNLDAVQNAGIAIFHIALAGGLVIKPGTNFGAYQSQTLQSVPASFIGAPTNTISEKLINSRVTPFQTGNGSAIGGAIVQQATLQAAIDIGSASPPIGFRLDGDILLVPTNPDNANSLRPTGTTYIGRAGLFGVLQTNGASAQTNQSLEQVGSLYSPGDTEIWGPGQIQVTEGWTYSFDGGGTPTAVSCLLVTGANYSNVPLTFEYASQTTGFPWVNASHAYGAAVALTAANIDSNGGLSWPLTGSKFTFRE